ncbi:MAG TPA: hypothetical protein VEF04_14295, partial [Blastocatellia bacterium]|nr:hypothetical protein [Blastocatellia bacterium]
MSTGLSSFSVSIKQLPSFRTPHLINAIFLLAVLLCPAFCAFASPTSSPAPTQASATTPQNNSVNTQSAPPASTDNDRLPFMIEERQEAPAPSGAGLIMRTLGALMLIVGMIAAGAWALKKYGGSRFGSASPDAPALQVMSSVG